MDVRWETMGSCVELLCFLFFVQQTDGQARAPVWCIAWGQSMGSVVLHENIFAPGAALFSKFTKFHYCLIRACGFMESLDNSLRACESFIT